MFFPNVKELPYTVLSYGGRGVIVRDGLFPSPLSRSRQRQVPLPPLFTTGGVGGRIFCDTLRRSEMGLIGVD